MRVAGIEITGHPAIGSLRLDFRDASGKAARTIILAGENGCGKTIILELLHLALGPSEGIHRLGRLGSVKIVVLVELDIDFTDDKILDNGLNNVPKNIYRRWPGFLGSLVILEASHNGDLSRLIIRMADGKYAVYADAIELLLNDGLGCFFSQAATTLPVSPVTGSTGLVDYDRASNKLSRVRSESNLSSQIAQLFVDLNSADNQDVSEWLANNAEGRPPETVISKRMKIFVDAFERLFNDKKFIGVEHNPGDLSPTFEQYGRRVPLAKLSTGEKQIVCGGAFLLREAKRVRRAVVLIDEPELSLHPAWQGKILSFYETIVEPTPQSKNQLVIVTHSPFVVHGSPTAKHVILKRRSNGRIVVDPTPSYPSVSSGDIAVAAFNLTDIYFGKSNSKLALVTEGKTDARILAIAWKKLFRTRHRPFHLIPAGGAKTVQNLIGTSRADRGWLLDAVASLGIDRFLCLFDFDDPGYGQWNGLIKGAQIERQSQPDDSIIYRKRQNDLVWAALLPVPHYRSTYASLELASASGLAIEALFEDEYIDQHLDLAKRAGDGRIYRASEPQKLPFANIVHTFPPKAFEGFRPIFELAQLIAEYAAA